MSKGMDLGMDDSQSEYLAGYINGISTEISTTEHIDSVLDFASRELNNRFEMAVDEAALFHDDLWHHVYEWGDTWDTKRSNVGLPHRRLWKLITTGRGKNRSVGFTFLPSVKPSPIHPEERKRGVEEGKHIFTWKAPVMEYGMTMTIEPVEALKGMLIFYWEKLDKVVAAKKVVTKPDPNVRGVFTGFFVAWWSTVAPVVFERDIRPMIERDIVPRGQGGRFVKGRSKAASRALALGGGQSGTRQSLNVHSADEERGRQDAIKSMQRIAAGYRQRRGGYDNYGH